MPPPVAYVARPALALDGTDNTALAADLIAALVEESSEGLYHCEVRFNNWGPRRGRMDYLYFDRSLLDFGKELVLSFGPPSARQPVFKGRISAIEAEFVQQDSAEITVLAEDRLQDLRMTRRTRTFEDMSDADIVRQIANDHSLTPQIDMQGPTHKAVAQVNLSDLAFVRARARCCDAEVWVEDRTLHAVSRSSRDAGTVRLTYGVDLIAFQVRADLAHQRSEVGVSGWDVGGKSAIEETAEEAAISAELGSLQSGGGVLTQAFAARRERVVHTVPLNVQEARAVAQARYRERARRFVTGMGSADGNPAIRVGGTLELSRLGGLFDGRYYVSRVRHTYDLAHGFRTEFEVERVGIGRG